MCKKFESEKQENEKLKQMNRYLLQGEYGQANREDCTPIY
jgi:hypothetical protein